MFTRWLGKLLFGWIGQFVQSSFDAPLMGDVSSALLVMERFPWPGKEMRDVAADLQGVGIFQPLSGVAMIEQRVEALGSPVLEGFQHALRAEVAGWKG